MSYFEQSTIVGNEKVREEVGRHFLLREVPEAVLEKAVELKYECSAFTDPGPDWTRVHFIDADGECCGTLLIEGC